ncbi:MAG: bifunctional phosphopantothenoylcysteine decarboxylase/phosphopantothenate--cysteine ligase CoaBC [Pseudomonadota bacterium]
MADRRVLLIIGGGIAAYKALETIRRLAERGVAARAILTRAGAEFVTPLSVGALTGEKVFTDLFDLTDEAEMGHIELSRSADLLLVAPATADLMAKAAGGHADDLASTALLATDKPVLFAPAMNVRMWEHAATQRNVGRLKADGALFVGPNEGDMACGEFGAGRMAEPDEIAEAVESFFAQRDHRPLTGASALVTAGPTHEPIDPVRYLANRSSGKQGYAIAAALSGLGADVTLVTGPTALDAPDGLRVRRVETAREMAAACQEAGPFDVAVCAAAVADFRPELCADGKIKKERGGLKSLALTENPDILASLSAAGPARPQLVVGFAAETDDVVQHAQTKRLRKGCDWIVANDVSPATGVMGGDANTVHIVSEAGVESWLPMPKTDVAARLAQRIADVLSASDAPAEEVRRG